MLKEHSDPMMEKENEEQLELFDEITKANPEIQATMDVAQIHLLQAIDMVNKESSKQGIIFQRFGLVLAYSKGEKQIHIH
jgi:hypothetical protein